jgi:hypothetical protein
MARSARSITARTSGRFATSASASKVGRMRSSASAMACPTFRPTSARVSASSVSLSSLTVASSHWHRLRARACLRPPDTCGHPDPGRPTAGCVLIGSSTLRSVRLAEQDDRRSFSGRWYSARRRIHCFLSSGGRKGRGVCSSLARAISAFMAYVAAAWWAGAGLPWACCSCLAFSVSLVLPRRVASERVAGGGAAGPDASARSPLARSAVAIGAVRSWTCSKLASGSRSGRPAGRGEQGRELVHRRRRDRPVLLLPA